MQFRMFLSLLPSRWKRRLLGGNCSWWLSYETES